MTPLIPETPQAPAEDEERMLDSDIISSVAMAIMEDADGMNSLISAAGNTPDPAKGSAQYLMMMFDAIDKLLEQTGIPFDFGVVAAKGGVMDQIVPQVEAMLMEAGLPIDESFSGNLMGYFLEMVKAASSSEGAPAASSPTANASPLLAQFGG